MVRNAVDKTLFRIENIFVLAGVLSIFSMMIIITLNVIRRYLFDAPIRGAVDFVTLFLMTGLVFFSLSYVQRKEKNVRADIIYKNLSIRKKSLIDALGRIFVLLVLLLLTYLTSVEAYRIWEEGQRTVGTVRFPLAYSWAIIPIGLTILCTRILIQVINNLITIKTGTEDD